MRVPLQIFPAVCLCLLATAAGLPSAARAQEPVKAARSSEFLNSIGVNSAISRRGETLARTVECTKYLGIRWFRSGPEGGLPVQDVLDLHRRTGARVSWGLLSGGADIDALLETARPLARAGALLAFEGPNEPNNWGITYQGIAGGRNESWLPVAHLQRDLYRAVKADPVLRRYPVFGISENGAETVNVGLQFLKVPPGAGAAMPEGTAYADFANVHNYVYHPNSPGVEDNKTWNAADPGPGCRVDGLFGEYGRTWGRHFPGYSEKQLLTLPRVTTETGSTIEGPVTEKVHALNLLSLYLDQFKRGWGYTAVYLLRDRSDEGGNQQFGFYKPDYTPRLAALYLHNLTTILADRETPVKPGTLRYSLIHGAATVHDLLLQRSDGLFLLVVWDEKTQGSDDVTVTLGAHTARVTLFDPTVGTGAIRSLAGARSVPLTLSDHPVVLQITPRGSR